MNSIKFQFTGGMTDNHEMNFYEAGRFQYAAARFIYTLEHFRQSGRIKERISFNINADIRVRAPQQGSFIQEVILHSAPIIAEPALRCSFEALYAFAWNLILPRSNANDVAIALSKQETEREKQRTIQEKERTAQTKVLGNIASEAIAAMAKVSSEAIATTPQTLKILEHSVLNGLTLNTNGYNLDTNELTQYRDEAADQLNREIIISQNQEHFNSITPETERRLASQLRNPVKDIVLPLKKSAVNLNISQGNKEDFRIASINSESARSISEVNESDSTTRIYCLIKSYDVETGYGKFREGIKLIAFRVPTSSKNTLKPKILQAMNQQKEVWVVAYEIKDAFGSVISLILDNINEVEPLDELGLTK